MERQNDMEFDPNMNQHDYRVFVASKLSQFNTRLDAVLSCQERLLRGQSKIENALLEIKNAITQQRHDALQLYNNSEREDRHSLFSDYTNDQNDAFLESMAAKSGRDVDVTESLHKFKGEVRTFKQELDDENGSASTMKNRSVRSTDNPFDRLLFIDGIDEPSLAPASPSAESFDREAVEDEVERGASPDHHHQAHDYEQLVFVDQYVDGDDADHETRTLDALPVHDEQMFVDDEKKIEQAPIPKYPKYPKFVDDHFVETDEAVYGHDWLNAVPGHLLKKIDSKLE